ncbi:MAG: hypothetical protein JST10_16880 [Bacteroidetes bacterium]|nr:hypothetical protein [Bacteroidota bacterium]MBS1634237.1 hypothetical protein [Bacteroidota bacterium]
MVYKLILILLLLFPAGHTYAQKKITVQATVDKNKILIGERIHLSLKAVYPPGSDLYFFSIDSIPHFEIIQKAKADTEKTTGGIILKQEFQLTSFDSGHWKIPVFALKKTIKTDPIAVDVVFSDFDPSKDYHDIKDVIEVPFEKDKTWWIVPAILSVMVIAAIVWLLRKKKSFTKEVTVSAIDPYREAMLQLQEVQKKTGSAKEYYSFLTDIFRLYVFRKKGIHSLQDTTEDLLIQLRSLNLDIDSFSRLSQSLQLSDSVKFAKFVPSEQDNRQTFETIKNTIERIENSKL